jgi:hypothetical protein
VLSPDATLIDVAFAVCTALDRAGERALLVGGSAATYYAPQAYQSSDCDFILLFGADPKSVIAALAAIGFIRAPEGYFRHQTTEPRLLAAAAAFCRGERAEFAAR